MAAVPILAALVALPGCGSDSPAGSPTSPSPPPVAAPIPTTPSYAGVWQGEYRVTACVGERHCTQVIGAMRAFTLRLEQTGAAVAGVLTGDVGANLTGVVSASGELTLSGGVDPASRFDTQVAVRRLTLRPASGGALTGGIEYAITYPPGSPYLSATGPVSSRSGEIVRAARASGGGGDPLRFDGAWNGRFVVRRCVIAGWANCYPHEPDEIVGVQLELRQNGAEVEGTVAIPPYRIPVRGVVQGNQLHLEGELVSPVSGGRMALRFLDWTTTRDAVGRLEGRFGYDVAYQQDTGGTLSTIYENELVGVVLSP